MQNLQTLPFCQRIWNGGIVPVKYRNQRNRKEVINLFNFKLIRNDQEEENFTIITFGCNGKELAFKTETTTRVQTVKMDEVEEFEVRYVKLEEAENLAASGSGVKTNT